MRRVAAIIMGLLLVAAKPADDAAHKQAPIFSALVACRAITDSAQRLACYDANVGAIDNAEKSGDVVVADRAQIRESRKALFGFGSIILPIFGHADPSDVPQQIEAKITGVSDSGYGKWVYTLDNGMVWRQVESVDNYPRAGQTVTIKPGALGNYFLKVGKQPAVRAMRIQ